MHTYDCLGGDDDRKFRSVLAVFEQACREILTGQAIRSSPTAIRSEQ
jgi:hypothetical protein